MFLHKMMERNKPLVEYAIQLHQAGGIMPDTYMIDLDMVIMNAREMLLRAKEHNLQLFFMAKQIGRNPLIAQKMIDLGFDGIVAVDFKDALMMHKHGIPIAHVGHLVQVPTHLVEQVVAMKPLHMTVYSYEKAKEINNACAKLGMKQEIMLRIISDKDVLYPGQYGGFALEQLTSSVGPLLELEHVHITGITTFPCFLYDADQKDLEPTPNVQTLMEAKNILEQTFGLDIPHVNMPSATCAHTIPKIKQLGGTQGEPGHGVLGSTPLHAEFDLVEKPAMIYVSEISHQLGEHSYCYGGGFYGRSGMNAALISDHQLNHSYTKVHTPELGSIDYHFELEGQHPIGATVIMAYRTQIFVTRSHVAIVKGLSEGKPSLVGIYDSQGMLLHEGD